MATKKKNGGGGQGGLDPDSELDVSSDQAEVEQFGTDTPVIPMLPSVTEMTPTEVSMDEHREVKAMVQIPLRYESGHKQGYLPRHVELRLNHTQATTLKALFGALHEGHERLESGSHVDSYSDAFKWLLDRARKLTNSP